MVHEHVDNISEATGISWGEKPTADLIDSLPQLRYAVVVLPCVVPARGGGRDRLYGLVPCPASRAGKDTASETSCGARSTLCPGLCHIHSHCPGQLGQRTAPLSEQSLPSPGRRAPCQSLALDVFHTPWH